MVLAVLSCNDAAETFRHLEGAGVDAAFKIKSLAECVEAQELSRI